MTEQQFSQILDALKSGRVSIRDRAFAGLPDDVQLEPWSETIELDGFGVTADTDIEVTFETIKKGVIVTDLLVNQYLTANVGSTTMPVGVVLPNAGLYGDGADLKSGLGFRFKIASDYSGQRNFSKGWLLSSAMEGPLFDRYPLGFGMDQSNSKITLTLQTLAALTAGDVYAAQATLRGYFLKQKEC